MYSIMENPMTACGCFEVDGHGSTVFDREAALIVDGRRVAAREVLARLGCSERGFGVGPGDGTGRTLQELRSMSERGSITFWALGLAVATLFKAARSMFFPPYHAKNSTLNYRP